MKIVKRVVIVLVSLLALILLVAMLLPSKVHVERSLSINAPPERIFPLVNDLRQWHAWSPWHQIEPDAEYVYSGPAEGVGATAAWKGKQVGEGKQVITVSDELQRIETQLDFGSQGQATSDWVFQPTDGGATDVTWGFDIDMGMNPIGRLMGLMINRAIGRDYQQGLQSLKTLCESSTENDVEPETTSE